MGIFLCGFQQNAGLNIFCQHTKQQKIENILCKCSLIVEKYPILYLINNLLYKVYESYIK